MDLKKNKVKKRSFSAKSIAISLVVIVSALLIGYFNTHETAVTVKRDNLLLGTVKQGDLQVEINGYGTLRSDRQLLISSLTNATVQEILLKPGAPVTQESVIATLANPELQQQLDSAVQALAQQKANLRQLKLNQQRQLLNETARLAEMEASYATAKVRLEAQQSLIKAGIVSALDFKESQVLEAQLKKQISIHKKRTEALKLVNQEAINIQLEQIKQQQGQLDIARNRLESLVVKAGFNGVLQRLSVELGQSLSAGQEIALIGSVKELVALVRVPQSKAQQIEIGHQAVIDTRRDHIKGSVTRIDPVVVENTVEIEIALPTTLPSSARPQLSIDAVIITDTLEDITYIERPVNIKAHSTTHLFQVDESLSQALKAEIKFGREAGRYIEVVSGAQVNERFIVSDLSQLKSAQLNIDMF